jgi:hypothetical protein
MRSRLGEIVTFYSRRKIHYESILNRCVLGRELFNLLHAPDVDLPNNFNPNWMEANGFKVPVPYEIEMSLN